MRFLDLSWGILFEPSDTLRRAAQDPPLWGGFIAVLLASTVAAVTSSFGMGMGSFTALLIITLLVGLGTWVLRTAVWRFLSELLGGTGSARALFAGTGLSQLPRVFAAPGALLSAAAGSGVGFLVSLGVGVWILVLNALAVRETEGLSLPVSVAVVLAPYLVLVMGLILLILLLVLLAVAAIVTMDPSALLGQ